MQIQNLPNSRRVRAPSPPRIQKPYIYQRHSASVWAVSVITGLITLLILIRIADLVSMSPSTFINAVDKESLCNSAAWANDRLSSSLFLSRHPEHIKNFAKGLRIFRCDLKGKVLVLPVEGGWRDVWYKLEVIGAGMLVVGAGIGFLVGEWVMYGGQRERGREKEGEIEGEKGL